MRKLNAYYGELILYPQNGMSKGCFEVYAMVNYIVEDSNFVKVDDTLGLEATIYMAIYERYIMGDLKFKNDEARNKVCGIVEEIIIPTIIR